MMNKLNLLIAKLFIVLLCLFVPQDISAQSATKLAEVAGRQDIYNTTITPLDNGQTYTGIWHLSHHPDILVTGKTDQSGSLSIQFSPDTSNVDSTITRATDAGVPFFHRFVKGSRFHRILFTNNSGSNQTYFRLQTSLGTFGPLTSLLTGATPAAADSIVTRPVPFDALVALGRVGGWASNDKFGRSAVLNTNDDEDVWLGGDTYTGFPATCPGEKIQVSSSSENDTSAGTGAQTFTLLFLNDSFEAVTETVSLNGTTPVDTTSNGCRVNRSFVATAGSGGTAAGVLTVANTTTTSNVFASIAVGLNQSQVAAYTVPDGKVLVLKRILPQLGRTSGAAGSADGYLMVREPGGVFRVRNNQILTTGNAPALDFIGMTFPEHTDIKYRVENVSDNNTVATASLIFYLVDE